MNYKDSDKRFDEKFERYMDYLSDLEIHADDDIKSFLHQELDRAREETITQVFVDIGLRRIKEGDNWKKFYKLNSKDQE